MTTDVTPPKRKFRLPPAFQNILGPLVGLIAVLVIFLPILHGQGDLGRFASPENLRSLFHSYTVQGIVALGMLLIIVSGGIDLSVGSVAALVTVLTMLSYNALLKATGSMAQASVGAVGVGVCVGCLCGLINGLIITFLRVTPFITTLGMLSIARGLCYKLTDGGRSIPIDGATPGWIPGLAVWFPKMPMDLAALTWLGLAVLVAVVMRYTIFGRYCYAIGSNEATARLCGVPVNRYKILIYGVAGLLTGWAGVLMFANIYSGDPHVGTGLELDVIAAVVIGGARLSGGQGTVLGTVLGVLILAVLENAVSFATHVLEVKYFLIGGAIVANTALSRWQQRRRGEA